MSLLKFEDIVPPFDSEIVEIDDMPVIVPILGVKFGETALKLHWWNSTVLRFGNARLNHVEYKGPEGKKGIRFDDEMIEMFGQMLYPTYYRPLPDEATLGWYAQLETASLDSELDEL